MPVKNRLAEMQEDIAQWRRHLHANPELRFEEHETAGFVAGKLREFGCDEVVEGVGGTGVVGVIRGHGGGDRAIAFRADMDALPINEATGAAHASTRPGKMHACGHDGHTAMLLGAARYLAETRNFDGSVVLLFQPAEEGGGGAKAMVDAGVMERGNVAEVYGLHNWPGMPVGHFAMRPGPQMAAPDKFEILVRGKGGHGAMPHLGVDTVLAASQIVQALQSIASRNVDPLDNVVVSVCGFRSESDTYNVLPDSVSLKGTVRTLKPEVQALVRERIEALARLTAQAHGAEAELTYIADRVVLVNDPQGVENAAHAARRISDAVETEMTPVMGGEDFADMLSARPGAYIFIGNGASADLHNPRYEFNDAAIPFGTSWFAELAETRMPIG